MWKRAPFSVGEGPSPTLWVPRGDSRYEQWKTLATHKPS